MNLKHSAYHEPTPAPEIGAKGPFYFNEEEVLEDLKHFLPAQAPLKDFIHHNTLHAFQHLKFFKALQLASEIFGYKVSLSLEEYRSLFKKGNINDYILDRLITQRKGTQLKEWKEKMLSNEYQ